MKKILLSIALLVIVAMSVFSESNQPYWEGGNPLGELPAFETLETSPFGFRRAEMNNTELQPFGIELRATSGWDDDWGDTPSGDPIEKIPIEDCYPALLLLVGTYFLLISRKRFLHAEKLTEE